MTTRLRVSLWRVPTIVAGNDIEATVRNMISHYTHEQRLDLLRDGVDRAMVHFGAAPASTTVVNVFIVPEYFFAYSHRLHFVDEHTKDLTIRGLKEISTHGNTLLFPGTIPWIKTMKKGNAFTSVFQSSRYNRAIDRILKTRELFEPQRAANDKEEPTSVQKLRSAKAGKVGGTVYYAQNTAWVMRGGEVLLKYHKRMNGSEISKADIDHLAANGDTVVWVPGIRTGSFNIGNLVFGLEICAEHDGRALQTSMGGQLADVQVVISATMKVQTANTHLRDGGYLLHCDAIENPSVHRKQGAALALVAPGTASAKSLLPATEIAGRSQTLTANAAAKKKSDADRDAMIAEMTTFAGGTLHYYELDV